MCGRLSQFEIMKRSPTDIMVEEHRLEIRFFERQIRRLYAEISEKDELIKSMNNRIKEF